MESGGLRSTFSQGWSITLCLHLRYDADAVQELLLSKRRCELSAGDLEPLYERINRQLDRLGVETQPKVAMRLLELSQNPQAQFREYHDVIKFDWNLTGRILRLANSAYYAQVQPVTRLDRALVILGIERIKAVSLGFYLSRAASTPEAKAFSRQTWGQSVYRATLAGAMARVICPAHSPEAFVIGLMLDCGQPLLARLLGPSYEDLCAKHPNPVKRFNAEFEELDFTHVDVVTALAKRWKMPNLLQRPIAWHHTAPVASPASASPANPGAARTIDPLAALHRVAHYIGALQLDDVSNLPATKAPMSIMAERLFDMLPGQLEQVVKMAGGEYSASISLFSDVGDSMSDMDAITEFVQTQLVEVMDEQMQRSVKTESKGGTERLNIAGQLIEVEAGRDGEIVAFVSSSVGERLLSATVNPAKETPESIGRMLGLDDAPRTELLALAQVMQQMAA